MFLVFFLLTVISIENKKLYFEYAIKMFGPLIHFFYSVLSKKIQNICFHTKFQIFAMWNILLKYA